MLIIRVTVIKSSRSICAYVLYIWGNDDMFRFIASLSLALLVVSSPVDSASAASTKCKKPKSGVMGFFGGMADKLGSRIGGTGIVGDLLAEGRKLLSDTIACALSEAENKQALAAQNKALNSKKTGKASKAVWTSSERGGVNGGTEITSRTRVDGQECALQRTYFTDTDGIEKSVDKELCQQSDGTWV